MVVRTNIHSINAHRNLKNVGLRQTQAAQRLSSGFRVNSAADDAAGLAISETMRAQILGLDQAWRNAQDAIALVQTAEGGIATINEMIIRMRELVVQAANDTLVICNREMIQHEIDQLIQEIDALSERVQFNTMHLLRGDYARPLAPDNSIIALPSPVINPSPATEAIQPISAQPEPTLLIHAGNFLSNEYSEFWSVCANGVLTIHDGPNLHVIQINGEGLNALGLSRIVVESESRGWIRDIILNDVNINTNSGPAITLAHESNVSLWLAPNSTNIMTSTHIGSAGVQAMGNFLNFRGEGSLTANGGLNGAGIGGGNGSSTNNIFFTDNVTVTAMGGNNGAGIGGGNSGDGNRIYIEGNANVNAMGGSSGAGIGGGANGGGSNDITVGGNANLIAMGGIGGAGIGGGWGGNNTLIDIWGSANVIASGGDGGAGVGGGLTGNGGNIHISGDANVTAWGGTNGAGIGGGGIGNGGQLFMSGGLLEITGGGIGGGLNANNHGTTFYGDGNISFGNNEPNIPGGVWDFNANELFHYPVLSGFPPNQAVKFGLYVQGTLRNFSAITDSNGNVFVWLPEPPESGPILPPNGNGNNGKTQPLPVPVERRGFWFQTGANAKQGMTLYIENINAHSLGLKAKDGTPLVNVLKNSGADISPVLEILDDALLITTGQRAVLGAIQNRLEFTSQNLLISSENLTEAESRIRNADMAREMAAFTMSNVLRQAAISMLAQANQLTEAVLQLLNVE